MSSSNICSVPPPILLSTQNQSKYYYSPRFRHFNIYRRDPDGDTKVDDAATQEEAKRKVYELNGWNYKPKNNTVK